MLGCRPKYMTTNKNKIIQQLDQIQNICNLYYLNIYLHKTNSIILMKKL